MFDVGFWELCLVGLVSLLVIGPEKLPKVARIAGFWVGKARTMVASVKTEIKEELQAEELRQIFKEQAGLEELHKALGDGSDVVNDFAESLKSLPEQKEKQTDESKRV
ncbi:MAG: twin-arginine translocase subunit TatB [Methylococcales bacterium]|nr:twin-arginine translocase subunit TatB [Methylococcales bacterium]